MVCYFLSYGISYLITINLGIKTSISIIENISVILGMLLHTINNFLGQKKFVIKKNIFINTKYFENPLCT